MDAYNSSAPVGTSQSFHEPKPSISQLTISTCDQLPVENGSVERTVFVGNSALPRKRLRRSWSSSPQNDVVDSKLVVVDGVAPAVAQPVCATVAVTSATAVAPSPCLPWKTLPLSSRIIGTVWQPVQSQSTTAAAAVSASNGSSLSLDFCSQAGHSRGKPGKVQEFFWRWLEKTGKSMNESINIRHIFSMQSVLCIFF